MAWRINMKGLRNVLDACGQQRKNSLPFYYCRIWPYHAACKYTADTVMEPNTIYGISKQAGERWCDWYFQKRGLDCTQPALPRPY